MSTDPSTEVVIPTTKELTRPSVRERYASSPRVPVHLKTRRMHRGAPAARRRAVQVFLRALLLAFPASVGRGIARAVFAWWAFVWAKEERQQAREAGTLHQHGAALREMEKYRWIGTGAVLAVLGIVVLVVRRVGLPGWWAVGLAVLVLVLAFVGRRVVEEQLPVQHLRGLAWMFAEDHLATALREAGLLGKEQNIRVVSPPMPDGDGWAVTIDLPGARKASTVIKGKEDLAASLDLDEARLVLERDRSSTGHASRLTIWASEDLPFMDASTRSQMASAERWDIWRPAPFGTDARGRTRQLSLLWSNILVGSRPGRGKSAACRVAAAPFVLDPTVRILCFDGKGGRDWIDLRGLAQEYVTGSDDDDAVELREALQRLKVEAQRRFATMREMPAELCPENKITPEIAADPDWDMPVTLVIVDELQNYTENGAQGWPEKGKAATVGDNVGSLLTWLAKNGRALGIILMLATQRPDANSLPTGLRAQMGVRFGLNMTDWQGSDMILGTGKRELGYDCSKLLNSWLGVGILVPDGEAGDADAGCPTIRTHYLAGHEWSAVCARGTELRGEPTRRLRVVEDIVDAEVVTSFADEVREVFAAEGVSFLPSSRLGARLKLSPSALKERLADVDEIEEHRTSKARGYRLVE